MFWMRCRPTRLMAMAASGWLTTICGQGKARRSVSGGLSWSGCRAWGQSVVTSVTAALAEDSSTMVEPRAAAQGQLVLVDGLGPGRCPPLAEAANCHAGRGPNMRAGRGRRQTQHVPGHHRRPNPSGSPPPPSGPGRWSSPVNNTRTPAARVPNRRSQPRTVPSGRPSIRAIGRCPTPVAFANSAPPITTTASARRTSIEAGSRTCVDRQPEQQERRGRTTAIVSSARTPRDRA